MLHVGETHVTPGAFDGLDRRRAQGLARNGAAGYADGDRACLGPGNAEVTPQLTCQSAVHRHNEGPVSRLALAVTLTGSVSGQRRF